MRFTFSILIIVFSSALSYSQSINLSQESFIKLSGVWDKENNEDGLINLSWGDSKYSYSAIVLDFGADVPRFYFGSARGYQITKIEKLKEKYIIWFKNSINQITDLQISMINTNEIFLHETRWNKYHQGLFRNMSYYKISSPKIIFFKPKTSDLRIRSSPSTSSMILRLLKENEKLLLLRKGPIESIYGVQGNWYKVITENDEIGWCHSFYLEEIK